MDMNEVEMHVQVVFKSLGAHFTFYTFSFPLGFVGLGLISLGLLSL